MVDFTRRRFLFGLAAVPLMVPVVKHFVMPKWEPNPDAQAWLDQVERRLQRRLQLAVNPPLVASMGGNIDWVASDKLIDAMFKGLGAPPKWFSLQARA